MINKRRFFSFLPLYVLAGVCLDVLSDSSASRIFGTSGALPGWVVAGFLLTATGVVALAVWYLVRRGRGVVPDSRHSIYLALLAAVVGSGVVEDIVKAASGVLLGGHPWWSLVPIYSLGYVIFWAVALLVVKHRTDRRTKPRASDDAVEAA